MSNHDDPTPQFVAAIKTGRIRGVLVPTGVLLSIAMASLGGAWAGAKFFYGNLEQRITATETSQKSLDGAQRDTERHVSVLEANAINANARLDEMNRKIDTVIDLLLHTRQRDDK